MTIFAGSSSIRMWRKIHKYFPSINKDNHFNRGFGGSQVCHLILNKERIFKGESADQNPHRIVIYSGDNDLGGGLKAETVRDHFIHLTQEIRKMGVKSPIYILTVKPSPKRLYLKSEMETLIELLENEYAGDNTVTVVNTFDFFFTDETRSELRTHVVTKKGKSRSIYKSDGVHLEPVAYEYWAKKLKELW